MTLALHRVGITPMRGRSLIRPFLRCLLLVLVLLEGAIPTAGAAPAQVEPTWRDRQIHLLHLLESVQWKEQNDLEGLWNALIVREARRGLFPSWIRLGHFFHGDFARPVTELFDRFLNVRDGNMFVTAGVLLALLEGEERGGASPSDGMIAEACDALLLHRDRNRSVGQPFYVFWEQIPVDGFWRQHPCNLATGLSYLVLALRPLMDFCAYLGFDLQSFKALQSHDIQLFLSTGDPSGLLGRCNMPPDMDDSGLALSLTAALLRQKERRREPARRWDEANRDLTSLLERAAEVAYAPDGDDRRVDLVDPRSYHWIRPFLDGPDGRDPLLCTTWLQHAYEGEHFGTLRTKMPFYVNNVDPVVCVNALGGVAALLAERPETERRRLLAGRTGRWFFRTLALVTWCLEEGVAWRNTDLALLYYPTPHVFFWYGARLLGALRRLEADRAEPAVARGREKLAGALRRAATPRILSRSTSGVEGRIWPGVLDGGEDETFASAVALCGLIDTWTHRRGGKLVWVQGTPEKVIAVVSAGARALASRIDEGRGSLHNACFSGSVKGPGTLPFFFPHNCKEQHGPVRIHAVRGRMDAEGYQTSLARTRSRGMASGKRSERYSHWSSPAFTVAVLYGLCARIDALSR